MLNGAMFNRFRELLEADRALSDTPAAAAAAANSFDAYIDDGSQGLRSQAQCYIPAAAEICSKALPQVTMQFQLVRPLAFRQILYHALYSDARFCARPLFQAQWCGYHAVQQVSGQKRFPNFDFSRKRERKPKPVNIDPGFPLMLELKQMLRMGTRPPPPEALAKAFNEFFQARLTTSTPLEAVQIQHAITTFTHLREVNALAQGFGLEDEVLRVALSALSNSLTLYAEGQLSNSGLPQSHYQLATLLFEELSQRRQINFEQREPLVPLSEDLLPFIRVLSYSGHSLDARGIIESHWQRTPGSDCTTWLQVLGGFVREHNGNELFKTVKIMQNYKIPLDLNLHRSITSYCVKSGDMELTKRWYEQSIDDFHVATGYEDASVLKLCISKNEFTWGDTVFKKLLERNPQTQEEWNVIFQWAAAKGKGVDEIERMMKVMVRRNEGNHKSIRPDIETINGLVKLANSRNDPYTAERYVVLGQSWGFRPNAETYLLQLDYRLKVGDIDGARAVYSRLQDFEIPEDRDVPLINGLIAALCAEKPPPAETIMGLVDHLSERQARFELETVAALARFHLRRGETHDLVDLLHTHTYKYGVDQRAHIRDIFVEFCLDQSNSTALTWNAYSILRQKFAETDVGIRTKLMKEFFQRGRTDMACHVFGHMRQQSTRDERPTIETYIACFEGIAKSSDYASLETIHNMLKLDIEIEPNTGLYNSLMLAYTGCGEPRRALEFWTDIVHSREGPTYESLQIALRACETTPFGDRYAREIWSRLRKHDVQISREIHAAYIGALAGQALFSECTQLVNEAERDLGHKPDALMLALLHSPTTRLLIS